MASRSTSAHWTVRAFRQANLQRLSVLASRLHPRRIGHHGVQVPRNKSRLAGWLLEVIRAVVPAHSRIADPMCGTGAVSTALALNGYSVTAADSLTFPVVHARARLLIGKPPRFRGIGGYEQILRYLNGVIPEPGYFHREFSSDGRPANGTKPRAYFTGTNAAKIDAIRQEIRGFRLDGAVDELEHSLLLHTLILAVNEVANIAGTGDGDHRSTWSASALREIVLKPVDFLATPGSHEVFQARVEEIAANLNVDACYLDPPYTKRQYAGNYHVLETIAQEDDPLAVGEGGLRDWRSQASDFCYRRHAGQAFREVLKRLDVPHVFVSYSEDGQVETGELEAILRDFGHVKRHSYPLARYRSNARAPLGRVSEHLYHVRAYR